ncbi:MAG TPA: PQQ-binding-like beta-propeller repeat protein [Polyangiaceae bacterium LLY-WYZ-15_(1-7)]|nr:hypothetical protein [Myxococcales bacterium]MAT28927.1 hypothetical protein [Sandaracinus sp.]HJK91542.1 PQQ-binding-like beta-propeller repeat protein [Polyangiaceae bacterium LLY-WYZ-15_(1-7)]MBJ73057.1 hypothetical protein [Sandaracinus sp.]HJL00931.1 PQQ-binding-like beta-propeller repeat protein [Polyangiaceae bacterium LLY-WYZ-15_(1-7)]
MYREDGSADRSVLVASLNGRVFGFDAVTGERRWEHRVGGVHVELLVEEDRVFAAAADRRLHCFHYPTGEPAWEVKLPMVYVSRPTMLREADRLYVAIGGELACVDLEGNLLWHDPMKGFGIASMALGLPGKTRQSDSTGSR